jgi:NADPH2:quinone reductase
MRGGRMASGSGGRHPIRESAELGWFIVRGWFKPGRKSMVPYSIQWLMRFKPAWFRHDLLTLLDLLKQGKIKPLSRIGCRSKRRGARTRCWAKAECSARSC